ncbi:MAG: RNA polymerase sigma factor [Planctomycetota bacterium]|jgi:RNA polymerase sigma-70 factor (ECF subfamily)
MAEKIDDELLVEQFRRGDKSAFDRIVEQYSVDIAALANRLLGWPGDVEDVTQDIFLAAFLGLKKFRCECSLKSWLFTITINKCRTNRYKRWLRLRRFSKKIDNYSLSSDCEDRNMDADEFKRVRRAVASLPAKYREPVVLRYLEEIGTDEISRILGISKSTLNVRLSRARKRLREDLAEIIEL